MQYVVPATELTAVIFLLIILYEVLFENKNKDTKTKRFRLCLGLVVLSLLIDSSTYLMDGHAGLDGINTVMTGLSYVVGDTIIVSFMYYIMAMLNEKEKVSYKYFTFVSVLAGLHFVTSLGCAFTGKTFYIVDGQTTILPLCLYLSIGYVLIVLYMLKFILSKLKILGTEEAIALVAYAVFPLLALVAEAIFPDYSFGLLATAISITVIYVMVQAYEVEAANADELTKLGNRKAYDKYLNSSTGDEKVGVLFCDLNGLKEANDTLGHAAGDRLLIKFADILRTEFPKEHLFRISGDEFVVILDKVREEEFASTVIAFRNKMVKEGNIAAVGEALGPKERVVYFISVAEKKMYVDKRRYYEEIGVDRRRR